MIYTLKIQPEIDVYEFPWNITSARIQKLQNEPMEPIQTPTFVAGERVGISCEL